MQRTPRRSKRPNPQPVARDRIIRIAIDHAGYLFSSDYRRVVHVSYRRVSNTLGHVPALQVFHEPDGSCCRSEGWARTALRIQAALWDGWPVLWLLG